MAEITSWGIENWRLEYMAHTAQQESSTIQSVKENTLLKENSSERKTSPQPNWGHRNLCGGGFKKKVMHECPVPAYSKVNEYRAVR